MNKPLYYFLLLLVLSFNKAESQENFKLDSSNTQITFNARHFRVLKVEGTFRKFSGQLVLEGNIVTSGSLVIQVASIDTDNESRDKSLKSEDFLNANSFPQIRISFESNTHPTVITTYTKIKAVTQILQLNYEIIESNKLEVKFTISRKKFNLDFGTMDDLVSNEIKVEGIVSLSP